MIHFINPNFAHGPLPPSDGGGGHIQFSQKHIFKSIICIFEKRQLKYKHFSHFFNNFLALRTSNWSKNQLKNSSYLNFGLPSGIPLTGLSHSQAKLELFKPSNTKNGTKMKIWVLVEKTGPPPKEKKKITLYVLIGLISA